MINQKLHIWMNIPSFHQNDLFNELRIHCDEFEVIYAHAKDEDRINQGWNCEQKGHYKSKTIGKDLKFWQLLAYVFKNRKNTHIVNGIWAEKSLFFAIILLNIFKVNFLIYSEAPIPTKYRSFSKKIVLKFIIKPLSKLLIMRAKGFLAVSIFAVEYFESLGVKADKIYRFGYFRNVANNNFPKYLGCGLNFWEVEQTYKKVSLIFVGQLIERKGVINLLKAVKIISESHKDFHLTIIGTGELEPLLTNFIHENQLENTVNLLGVINSENIIDYIKKADLLILPSVFDGWGMVINEALQSYVPVLVSDKCGAKELVNHEQNGFIFQHNSVQSLSENLQKFLNLSHVERNRIRSFSGEIREKISISIVSNYLILCLKHCLKPQNIKPLAPWLNE